eukprot:CAMPEP_0178465728 /NCGR_PEP_ID=MMETSP0689_2-20121128/51513_1 /TAXON_ID=160604 /ORGANISM="Amphidinium massartii, Strain CS-259" /LENGTH=132 /DNA_ID=CAMNT_0020092681 /DNA_START=8 /DNA_END=406 /DNA_ORIENTATION=-
MAVLARQSDELAVQEPVQTHIALHGCADALGAAPLCKGCTALLLLGILSDLVEVLTMDVEISRGCDQANMPALLIFVEIQQLSSVSRKVSHVTCSVRVRLPSDYDMVPFRELRSRRSHQSTTSSRIRVQHQS